MNYKKLIATLSILTVLTASNETLAQGGLFQRGEKETDFSEMPGLLIGNREVNDHNVTVTNQTFEVPVGNETLILLATGLGYALFKRKEGQS